MKTLNSVHRFFSLFLLNLLLSPLGFAAQDSTTTPIRYDPQANDIIIADKGWITWPANAADLKQTFTTHTTCRSVGKGDYYPYIQMNFTKVGHAGASNPVWGHLRTFGICLINITERSGWYEVEYAANKNFADIYDQQEQAYQWVTGSSNVWASDSNWRYVSDTSERIGAKRPHVIGARRYNEVGAINWTLYCYPRALRSERPYTQAGSGSECDLNLPPFKNAGPDT